MIRILRYIGWVLLLAYFPVTMFFVRAEAGEVCCRRIVPDVLGSGGNVLMTNDGLLRHVKRACPQLVGQRLTEVDYQAIEQAIGRLDMVEHCEAWPTIGGAVHVQITQRRPVLRAFTSDGSYYMDAQGIKIPARPGMLAHTLIVSGHANMALDPEPLIELCTRLNNDDFWRAMIEQVYVTAQQEYILVPRVGDHVVEFGTVSDIDRKLDDLKLLYSRGWQKREWNVYKTVSLKYKGQIICTKR